MSEIQTGDYRPGIDDTDTPSDVVIEGSEALSPDKEEAVEASVEEPALLNGREITNRVFTLPNLLTLLRLVLLVPFVWLYCIEDRPLFAFLFLVISCITDALDGFIARRNNSISRLGMTFDPFVDRLVILTSVICVYLMGNVPLWILVVLVLRDLVLGIMHIRLRIEKREFRVAFIGKVTTTFLMAGFVSLVLSWPTIGGLGLFESPMLPGWGSASAPVGIWLLYIGTVLSLLSAIYYLNRYRKKD